MIEAGYSKTFIKAYKKKINTNPLHIESFLDAFQKFIKDPFDKSIKTHKLSGKLEGKWAFSIEFNLRVVFEFKENFSKAIFV